MSVGVRYLLPVQMMRSQMMGILADTGLGGRMLLTVVSSYGDDCFDIRPPLSDEDGPAYRQQDKVGEQQMPSPSLLLCAVPS